MVTMLKRYFGSKVVLAHPMTRVEYNDYRGWTLPADEDGHDEGYLIEYQDGGKPNDPRHIGYISWSPKTVFERSYREVKGENMHFGQALEAMKHGYKVARSGWNGKGMWIAISQGNDNLPASQFWNPHARVHALAQASGTVKVNPYFIMKAADGSIVMGWLASQGDLLAEDWSLLP